MWHPMHTYSSYSYLPHLPHFHTSAVDPQPPRPAPAPESMDKRCPLGVQVPHTLHPQPRVPVAGVDILYLKRTVCFCCCLVALMAHPAERPCATSPTIFTLDTCPI